MCIFNYGTTSSEEQACLFPTFDYPHRVIQRGNRRQQIFFFLTLYSFIISIINIFFIKDYVNCIMSLFIKRDQKLKE